MEHLQLITTLFQETVSSICGTKNDFKSMNYIKSTCMPACPAGWLLLALLLINCQDDDHELTQVKEKRMAAISASVEALIANKSCNGQDNCASIAWGAKPCGGPWEYLVYAPSNVDVPELENLVAEYNQLQTEVNQIKGLGSDCSFVDEPELACQDNVCVAL